MKKQKENIDGWDASFPKISKATISMRVLKK
jgi:hypothetical protein